MWFRYETLNNWFHSASHIVSTRRNVSESKWDSNPQNASWFLPLHYWLNNDTVKGMYDSSDGMFTSVPFKPTTLIELQQSAGTVWHIGAHYRIPNSNPRQDFTKMCSDILISVLMIWFSRSGWPAMLTDDWPC